MLKWIEANPYLTAFLFSLLWPVVTAIVTSVFSKPTPEFEQRFPRLAAIRRIPSDGGVNLPKLLANMEQAITGKIMAKAPAVAEEPAPPTPKNTGVPPLMMLTLGLVALVACGPVFTGCNAAKDAKFAADLIHCLDEHSELTPEQAALICGVQATPDFVNLFTERKLAKATSKPCVIVTVDAGPPKGPGI